MQSHIGRRADTPPNAFAPGGEPASGGRLPIDIRRLPWIRPLAADYALDYPRLAEFFAGNPAESSAWRDAISRAAARPRPRAALVDVLHAQQRRRSAPQDAIAAAASLADPRSVAIVTGQQAGLFGGPLFTLLKSITAIQLAERIRAEHGVPAVPIFWVDAEDHDWDEVKDCRILDGELAPRSVSIGSPPGASVAPVAHVRLDASIESAIADLEGALPPTEFTPGLLGAIRRIYRPGVGMADAFSHWLEHLLGSRGLIVFDASDAAAKPLAAGLFGQEIERAGLTSRLAAEAGSALVERGYHAQVEPTPNALALFRMTNGREAIRIEGEQFRLEGGAQSRDALLDRVRQHPAEFSPNVLLRPLVQDALFPTACYVAGPSELAYLAQLRRVYEAFAVPMPLVQPRATATIVDGNAMRFLSRHDVRFESLRPRDEGALNELLAAQLPLSVEASLREALAAVEQRMEAVAREVPRIDATLEGAARSTLSRMQDDLRKLQAKIVQAAKRKDDTLRRQFHHAQAQAFPNGQPQEREVGFVYFLNKYGPALVDRLDDALPPQMGTHWVIAV